MEPAGKAPTPAAAEPVVTEPAASVAAPRPGVPWWARRVADAADPDKVAQGLAVEEAEGTSPRAPATWFTIAQGMTNAIRAQEGDPLSSAHPHWLQSRYAGNGDGNGNAANPINSDQRPEQDPASSADPATGQTADSASDTEQSNLESEAERRKPAPEWARNLDRALQDRLSQERTRAPAASVGTAVDPDTLHHRLERSGLPDQLDLQMTPAGPAELIRDGQATTTIPLAEHDDIAGSWEGVLAATRTLRALPGRSVGEPAVDIPSVDQTTGDQHDLADEDQATDTGPTQADEIPSTAAVPPPEGATAPGEPADAAAGQVPGQPSAAQTLPSPGPSGQARVDEDAAGGAAPDERQPAAATLEVPENEQPDAAPAAPGGPAVVTSVAAAPSASPAMSTGGEAPLAAVEQSDAALGDDSVANDQSTPTPTENATPGAGDTLTEPAGERATTPAQEVAESTSETGPGAASDARNGAVVLEQPEPEPASQEVVEQEMPGRAEPEDPPEITNPPEGADDPEPRLPEPPAPLQEQNPAVGEEQPGAGATSAEAERSTEAVAAGAEPTGAEPTGAEPALAVADVAQTDTGVEEASQPVPAETATPETETQPAEASEGQAPVPEESGVADEPAVAEAEPDLSDPPAPAGGGGGEGAPIAAPPEPEPPDISGMEPQAALSAVSSLPATQLAAHLSGVSAAATRTVGDAQAGLAANPPSMDRPSGIPAGKDASLPAAPLPPLTVATHRSAPTLAGGPGAERPAEAGPPAAPAPVALRVPEATTAGDTQIGADDAAKIRGAVKALPTTDPALDVDAGPVPGLVLSGGEDPQQIDHQAGQLEDLTAGARADGLTDARADMGENDVLPQVPSETLTADLSGGEAGSGASAAGPAAPTSAGPAAGPPAGAPSAAIDAVAAEQGADQINASTQAQGRALGTARADHQTSIDQAKADTDKQVDDEIAASAAMQTEARRDVRTEVGKNRKEWVNEQAKVVDTSRAAADTAKQQADDSVKLARATARTDAGKAIKDGNEKITRERQTAEKSAREERAKAAKESESGGFFSWVGSKVKSFVDGVKNAIHAAFELARKAVDLVISVAQKLAVEAIEIGRKAVVAAIEIGGKALAAAGDIVLAGFPEARDRFRAKIQEKVAAARQTVNQLADGLKAGVKKLLDGLGKLLKGALSLMEKAYTAAIDAVARVVNTVIKAAKAWVDALVDFAVLVADIAASPGKWLSNLGTSLLDGVRHHVWPSLVKAVKKWFKSKVDAVVGVGAMILNVLRKGGITFAKIVTMAWTAIKESLPGILIQMLIEKLVAMLIPAAGALALIIDGIRAAWGAASQILAAFKKFIVFLKAVRLGNAGRQFGELVGAAAVAVMDFLANFVLSKLKGAGQKVGGTLRKMADKIMKGLKKVAGFVKTGAKAAAGAIKKGVVAAGAMLKKGAKALISTVKRILPKNLVKLGAKVLKKVVTVFKKGVAKVKKAYQKAKEKLFGKKKKKKPKETKQQRIHRAIERTKATVSGLLARSVSRLRLWATLKWLKLRWGWKQLEQKREGSDRFSIDGVINPGENVGRGVSTLTILHSGAPVAVGTEGVKTETPAVRWVRLGSKSAGKASQQYAQAIIQQRLRKIAEADIGRTVEIPLKGRTLEAQAPSGGSMDVRENRTAGGASSLTTARVNPEMAIRKGDDVGPFVRPDARTGLVPGVDPVTGEADPSRDSVHLYEITTMLSFVEGNKKMAIHKQEQATWTIQRVLAAFPNAQAHYTFIAPTEPDNATRAVIERIVAGLSAIEQARLTITWRSVGWDR